MARWTRRWTPALIAVVLVAAGSVAACSDDDGGGGATDGPTTTSTVSFEQRDTAIQLNVAATSMNTVAGDVGIRAAGGDAVEYCRSTAPRELAPQQSILEAAADAEVRRLAEPAVADLRTVIELCADGRDQATVGQALERYNTSFDRLRKRIEALLGVGTNP